MKLTKFITDHIEEIIEQWDAFARTLGPVTDFMTARSLRDHAKEILITIVTDMDQSQNADEQFQKSQDLTPGHQTEKSAASIHGALRYASDFSLLQLSAEFRALRATVLRLWLPTVVSMDEQSAYDMVRFNEGIDQALAESIVTFTGRSDQTREMFLAILGHDLRAPLATLSLAGDLLKIESAGREKIAQISDRVRRASRQMTIMVNDLIGYTRTTMGGGMPLSVQPIDVGTACASALDDARATHPQTSFVFEARGDLLGAFDGVRLHQLLTNLLINAAQYGDKHRPVTIHAVADHANILVTVQNYGESIAAESLVNVFKPLVQLDVKGARDDRPRTSLGLGLFIAREIAIAHQGTITLTSTKENGTTFSVSLPRIHTSETIDPAPLQLGCPSSGETCMVS